MRNCGKRANLIFPRAFEQLGWGRTRAKTIFSCNIKQLMHNHFAMKSKINGANHLYVYFFSFSVLSLNKSGTDVCMYRPSKCC